MLRSVVFHHTNYKWQQWKDICNAETRNRNPLAEKRPPLILPDVHVAYLDLPWRLEKTPRRQHSVKGRSLFSFFDVRRLVAQAALDDDSPLLFFTR